MEIFGLIMLALIAVVLQHVANWTFRVAREENDDDIAYLAILSFCVSCVLFVGCAYYLINHF